MELINKQPNIIMPFTLTEESKHQCDFLEIKNAGLILSQGIKEQRRRLNGFAENWEFSLCSH